MAATRFREIARVLQLLDAAAGAAAAAGPAGVVGAAVAERVARAVPLQRAALPSALHTATLAGNRGYASTTSTATADPDTTESSKQQQQPEQQSRSSGSGGKAKQGSGGRRQAAAAATKDAAAAADFKLVLAAYAQGALRELSAPTDAVRALLSRPGATEADVLAAATDALARHPAVAAAAPHLDRLGRVRRALAAGARWRAPRSPLELLLRRAGAAALAARYRALPSDALRALPEHAVVAAALQQAAASSSSGGGSGGDAGEPGPEKVLARLCASASVLLAASPAEVVAHPGFWRHARAALEADTELAAELERLAAAPAEAGATAGDGSSNNGSSSSSSSSSNCGSGGAVRGPAMGSPAAALEAVARHDALLAALIGAEAAKHAAALAATAPLNGGAAAAAEWLEGVAASGGDGSRHAASLRLAQWVAGQLALSPSCGAASGECSAAELVRRLAFCVPPPPELPDALSAAFKAAAPAILSALSSGQPPATADIEPLLSGGGAGEAGGALLSQLREWRAGQAAAGAAAVVQGLSRAEVRALGDDFFEAVKRGLQSGTAAGRAAMAAALAAANAGRGAFEPLLSAGGSSSSSSSSSSGSSSGAWDAVQPLAWAVHARGAGAAEELAAAALSGAAAAFAAEAAAASEAAEAAADLRAAFALEAEVARLSTVARADRLLSGETQARVEALLADAAPPALRPMQRQLLRSGALGGDAAAAGDASKGGAGAAQLLPALTALLTSQGGGSGSGGGASDAPRLLRAWTRVRRDLEAAPLALPPALQGLFEGLLAVDAGDSGSGSGDAEDAERRVARLRSRLAAFLAAWDADAAGGGASASASGGGSGGAAVTTSPADELGAARAPSWAGDGQEEAQQQQQQQRQGRQGRQDDGGGGDEQPYEALERVHHDLHIQRYLAVRLGHHLSFVFSACVHSLALHPCFPCAHTQMDKRRRLSPQLQQTITNHPSIHPLTTGRV